MTLLSLPWRPINLDNMGQETMLAVGAVLRLFGYFFSLASLPLFLEDGPI